VIGGGLGAVAFLGVGDFVRRRHRVVMGGLGYFDVLAAPIEDFFFDLGKVTDVAGGVGGGLVVGLDLELDQLGGVGVLDVLPRPLPRAGELLAGPAVVH